MVDDCEEAFQKWIDRQFASAVEPGQLAKEGYVAAIAALAAERARLAPVIEAALKWEEAQAEMHAASQMHTEEYLECARAAKIAEADLRAQVQALRATPGC